ncbi:MAG: HPr kinase/phosphatase C-terminal domain-containing protein [Hyphomicrobium sp.]|nr:HPr kinase/phosphatase C-terminal domain-containing protein [Hyphomicrobium sp.]
MAAGSDNPSLIVHATAVRLGPRAALIRGQSGSGKSDLALRCLGLARSVLAPAPMELVADDQVCLTRVGIELLASSPAPLAGLIEVRGLGILRVPFHAPAPVVLLVDLVVSGGVERYPDPWPTEIIMGLELPVMRLAAFEASAPLKLAMALERQPWLGDRT